jgi:glycolate oxidase iron-sulfur subunit
MQTNFAPERLKDQATATSEKILRTCVHCGFCTATCPTYLLLGDELDSPRGRIYLIKDMLENDRPATPQVVKHIDRCLSCLSCMTTCPSGVHYMHLVDHARSYIEETYERPPMDRAVRSLLAAVLPYQGRFRLALAGAIFGRPLRPLLRRLPVVGPRLGAMLDLAPSRLPSRSPVQGGAAFPPEGQRRGRVAILSGCAQPVLKPSINEAAVRLLNRNGIEVVFPKGEGCCGALVHHMGREAEGLDFARRTIDAWTAEIEGEGLDAIVITASGCGTTIKDYGFMLREDPAYAAKAKRVSELAKDITEYLAEIEWAPPARPTGDVVTYHSACSMQHGQKIVDLPKKLLKAAGFVVKDVPEAHICCGSAGTYNILQPELASRLRERKVDNIERTRPAIVATGNIGCMTQIGKGFADRGDKTPIVHTVELIDWATGGPMPEALEDAGFAHRPTLDPSPAARAAE